MAKPQNLRIVLSPEQREQIRQQTGRDVEAIELPVRELDGQPAPAAAK